MPPIAPVAAAPRRHHRRARSRRALLALVVCAWGLATAVLPSCALAWPPFLQLRSRPAPPATRTVSGALPAIVAGAAADAAASAPLSVPPDFHAGAAARAQQAQALWQELEAKGRLSPCWKRSLQLLRVKCAEVRNDDAMRSRLALFMATCDMESDGRVHPSFHCGTALTPPSELPGPAVRHCVQALSDAAYAAFLQYRLHADVLCAYLEEELYQQRTEAAVAAMHEEVEHSSRTLAALQLSGAQAMALLRDTQALQHEAHEAAASLRQQLGLLHSGQAEALRGLQQASNDILRTSSHTNSALGELHMRVQESAAEALASVQALGEASLRRFAEVEAQTRGVMRLVEQMEALHQLLARQRLSWQRVGAALGCLCGVLLATSPARTAPVRLPATLFTLLGCVCVPMLRRCLAHPPPWPLRHETACTSLCLAAAAAVVVRCALCDAEGQARRRRQRACLTHEEAVQLWAELQATQARMQDPPAPPLHWDTARAALLRLDAPLLSRRLVLDSSTRRPVPARGLVEPETVSPLAIDVTPPRHEREATGEAAETSATSQDTRHGAALDVGDTPLSASSAGAGAAAASGRKRGRSKEEEASAAGAVAVPACPAKAARGDTPAQPSLTAAARARRAPPARPQRSARGRR